MATALRCKLPYVVTFHGGGHSSPIRSRIRPAQIVALRYLLRRSEYLIATARFENSSTMAVCLAWGAEHFAYLPNGSELPVLARAGEVDPHLIVSLGRLERYKGHHRAIEALPYVLADDPDARLWIAGSGPYERELRELAHRLGVADRVEIREVLRVERARYAEELARARLAVLLSDFETHPLAAIEAAALGVPLVVTEGSGLDGTRARWTRRRDTGERRCANCGPCDRHRARQAPSVAVTGIADMDDDAAKLADLYRAIVRTPACAS